jgi:hypothetical protein
MSVGEMTTAFVESIQTASSTTSDESRDQRAANFEHAINRLVTSATGTSHVISSPG